LVRYREIGFGKQQVEMKNLKLAGFTTIKGKEIRKGLVNFLRTLTFWRQHVAVELNSGGCISKEQTMMYTWENRN
jgi:hypothetical protein